MINRLTNLFIILLILGGMFGGYYLANHGPRWELVPPNLTWLDPIYWRSDLDNMTPEEVVKWSEYQFVNGHVVRSADAFTKEYRDRTVENRKKFEEHWADMGLRYIIVSWKAERMLDTPEKVVIRTTAVQWAQDLAKKQPLTKVIGVQEYELIREGKGWRIANQKPLYARRLSSR